MRTARSSSSPGGVSTRHPWEEAPPLREEAPPQEEAPLPVNRILDTRLWKYYLAPNFLCGR